MSIFRKNPPLIEITLVSMALATANRETCCTSQLNKFITQEMGLSSLCHQRSLYIPMATLCQEKMVEVAYVDTEEEAILRKKGRRKHYVMTKLGRSSAIEIYYKNKNFYDEKIPFWYYNCADQLNFMP